MRLMSSTLANIGNTMSSSIAMLVRLDTMTAVPGEVRVSASLKGDTSMDL